MNLKEIGEFGLIEQINKDAIIDNTGVIIGIGDDAAAFTPALGCYQLLTTDMLVEKIHFDLQHITPWQLGYKAIAVNLSDIAAMGGKPRHAVISIGLPPDLSVEFILDLYKGMKEICREFAVNIVGGDTVASPLGLVINVAVTGEVPPEGIIRRSGAKPGDVLVVTGTLGDSACGLDLLSGPSWEEFAFSAKLITNHLTPKPKVHIGLNLAKWGATSADDVSDGLASEANEIATASGAGIRIYADKVPLSGEIKQAAALLGKSPLDYALFGGEDYQLLFTVSPQLAAALPKDEQLSFIGEVTEVPGVFLVTETGCISKLEPKGYNHFR